MGPEQLASGDVDARTDLFAFGSVLFEMLTGRSAFEGDDAAAIRAALLGADPPPVSSLAPAVPPALDAIVARCLAKDPAARWQTAGDLVAALKKVALQDEARARSGRGHADRSVWKRWGLGIAAAALASVMVWTWSGRPGARPARPAAHIRSLAVLPLENLSGDPEHDYFADGMTEQLIADLAKIHGLRVTARTSVMHYRDARKPAPEIARELQVDGIVEGSMARAGGRARVTARLADATGAIVWTGSFERDVRDVLTLQSEVARSIVSQIDVALTPQDQARLSAERAIDPEVHRLVLLGRHHAAKATESSLHTAIQFFESAIAADSGNAFAHAGLAEAYNALNGFYMAPEIAMPKAKRAAETAVRLDDGLADAHAELGYVHLVYDWDGAGAERELLRALDLNPTHAPARLSYAAYLSSQGRCDGAREQVGRAVQLDPLSIRTHAFGTLFLLFCRRYEEAIALANRGLELEPTAGFVLAFQGVAYGELRRFDEAIANFQKAVTFDRSLTIRAMQAHILAIAGRVDEARAVLRQVEQEARTRYFCPYEIGTVHVSLGDRDAAYQWFRKGTDERADCMPWLGIEPWLDPFRTDPRYRTLVQEIGLTPLDR
jgi:TolB-like protein/Flp pilus assembly protein TadD